MPEFDETTHPSLPDSNDVIEHTSVDIIEEEAVEYRPDFIDQMRERFERAMSRHVELRYVIPAFAIIVVVALFSLRIQHETNQRDEELRSQQIAELDFRDALREYHTCIFRSEGRATIRDLFLYLVNLDGIRDSRQAIDFRGYLDQRYPIIDPSQCGPVPEMVKS